METNAWLPVYAARNITLNLLNAISDRNRNRGCRRHCLPGMPQCRSPPYFTFAHAHTAPPPSFVIKRVGDECWRLAVGKRGVWSHTTSVHCESTIPLAG